LSVKKKTLLAKIALLLALLLIKVCLILYIKRDTWKDSLINFQQSEEEIPQRLRRFHFLQLLGTKES